MRTSVVAAFAVACGLVVGGCGSDSSGGGTPVEITAMNTSFSMTDIKLPAGQKVTFTLKNADQVEHNLTIEGLKVNKDVEGGKSGSATVTPKAGTYPFHCEYHPDKMKGVVTVS